MKNFKLYINRNDKMTSDEWSMLNSLVDSQDFKKGELIVRKNERFDKEIFIERGVVRGFLIDDEGNEKSTAFFQEYEFMSTSALRTKEEKSLYYYQAMCDTRLLFFNSKKLKAFLSQNKHLSKIGKQIKEKEIDRLSNRDDCLLQVKAKDKYLNFLKYYPNIERYISQKHIASYIGITPVSFSRIKKNLKYNKTVIN
ncbi:MAG: hypothetical protein COA58_11380 [Bacteroidetes bacterium]|nr:MAG: hypothetical protein COA58_11380 [Bacteroidota bacterium]